MIARHAIINVSIVTIGLKEQQVEDRREKRSKRQELLRRLNEAEELIGTSRREPDKEESKNAHELELERERNWRSSGGFAAP